MNQRRLSWIRQHAVTEGVHLDFDQPTLPGATCRVLGSVNIVSDPNVATTLGAGSEDVIVVLRSTDSVDLWVGPPRVDIGAVASSSLEMYINVWRQVDFTASRLPATIGVVSGSGLIAPTP